MHCRLAKTEKAHKRSQKSQFANSSLLDRLKDHYESGEEESGDESGNMNEDHELSIFDDQSVTTDKAITRDKLYIERWPGILAHNQTMPGAYNNRESSFQIGQSKQMRADSGQDKSDSHKDHTEPKMVFRQCENASDRCMQSEANNVLSNDFHSQNFKSTGVLQSPDRGKSPHP